MTDEKTDIAEDDIRETQSTSRRRRDPGPAEAFDMYRRSLMETFWQRHGADVTIHVRDYGLPTPGAR